MRISQRLLGLAAAAALYAPAIAGGNEHWIGDFDQAVKLAKDSHKDLLVDFTGSDWCIWCKRLDAEVFSDASFVPAAEKNFVLVSLDFPHSEEAKAKVPNAKRNEELSKKYSIQGFPTILLMTPDGEVFGKSGYDKGGAEPWLKNLEKLRTEGKKSLDDTKLVVKQYEIAKPDAKPKLLGDAIDTLDKTPADSPIVDKLVPIVKDAFKLDADNKLGLKLRACKALLTCNQFDADIEAAATQLDPKNEKGVFERLVDVRCSRIESEDQLKGAAKAIEDLDAMGIKDVELKKRLYAASTFWNMQFFKDSEKAKKWAGKLKEIAGDDENFKDLIERALAG